MRDPLIQTSTPVSENFPWSHRGETQASNIAKLEHDLREPEKSVGMVPGLAPGKILSGRKFANADYISIYTPTEVNIYDAKTTQNYFYREG